MYANVNDISGLLQTGLKKQADVEGIYFLDKAIEIKLYRRYPLGIRSHLHESFILTESLLVDKIMTHISNPGLKFPRQSSIIAIRIIPDPGIPDEPSKDPGHPTDKLVGRRYDPNPTKRQSRNLIIAKSFLVTSVC